MSRPLSEAPDLALQRRLRAGDPEALTELYRRHRREVHALCARLTDDDAADDLLQDTFLRVWRYRASLEGGARFSTWVYTIARNICHDHRRSCVREAVIRDELEQEPASCLDPVSSLLRERRREAVRTAVAALPDNAREAIILSRFHGLNYSEIAEICGCTEGAVKLRVHRAMRSLRRILSPREEEACDEL